MPIDGPVPLAAALGAILVGLEWGVPLLARRRYDAPTQRQRAILGDDLLPEDVSLFVSKGPAPIATSQATPGFGGNVVVREDCFERLDDDQLAALVAHEAGHVEQGHGWLRVVYTGLGVLVAAGALHAGSVPLAVVGVVAYVLATAPLYAAACRRRELAADAYAARVAGTAGTVSLLVRLRGQRDGVAGVRGTRAVLGVLCPPLRTHPPLQERLERVREQ